MTRLTISMPDDLASTVQREARRLREPVSAVVRRALLIYLADANPDAAAPSFVALGRSGRRHTARNAEKILGREWRDARRR